MPMPKPDLKTNPPKPSLFDTDAKAAADELNAKAVDKHGRDSGKNKTSQIRRFYDELVGWHERVGDDLDRFKECEAFIKMLNAKAAYAQGRGLVTREFVDWMRDCVRQVDDPTSLKHFRLHFEATVGFLKELRPR
jgi:CRISPR-associated protein Csm2